MKTQKVNIKSIKSNPNNPRVIKDDKFKKLVQSIKDFPEMLEIRPIVINKDNVVLGGNMRLKALEAAGIFEVPVIKASDLTEEQQKEFIIKDNVGFGEWEWETLANEWDADKLSEWGLDVPKFESAETDEIDEAQHETDSQFFLNIRCNNENECQELYEKFIKEGLDVKIVT